jgi:hypothetical protein
MANILRIKRRTAAGGAGAPAALKNAELAYNEASNILYYGSGNDGNGNATSILEVSGSGAYVGLTGDQSIAGTKTFTGTVDMDAATSVLVPTISPSSDSTTKAASTAFVQAAIAGFGSGSVTSVGLSLPTDIFNVANSPVTSSGTLTVTLDTQSANTVWAGPSTGAAATPAFRALVAADIPTLTAAKISDFDTQVRTNRLDQLAKPTASVDLNGQKILNVGTPTSDSDAANKAYVDAVAQGLHVHTAVKFATAAALPSYVYNNGTSGVGATLTASANGLLSVDGGTLTAGDRVLVKNEVSGNAPYNGVYVVTATGGASALFVLTRAADMDSAVDFPGAFEFVTSGDTFADSGWVCTTDSPVVVGTTAIAFSQFSGAGQIDAGNGLTKTGNTLNVGTASAARIVVNADSIDLATVTQTDTDGAAGINFVQSIAKDAYGRVTGRVLADVRAASTSQTGIVQLTDSTSSTSTTTAATPASVKSAFDLANAALPKSGGTMTGKITLPATTTSLVAFNFAQSTATPSTPTDGDFWLSSDTFRYYDGSATKTLAFTDSNITGTASNVTGTVVPANGGTGLTSYAIGDLLYASGSTTLAKLAGVATGNVLISGGVTTAPSWGKVGLTTHVSGLLALANGGTGADLSSAAAGTIFKTNGSNLVAATPGTDYLNDSSTLDGGTF